MVRLSILIFSCIIFLNGCQEPEVMLHGELSGTVRDSQVSEPVSTATVILTELNDTIYTDDNGVFLFSNLIPGNYRIKVSKQHYAPVEENVTVKSAERVEMDIDLDSIPVLSYSTSLLDFGYYNNSVNLVISKSGTGSVSYLISPGQSWINVNPEYGDLDAKTDTVTVSIDRSELVNLSYNELLVIRSVYQQYLSQDTIDLFVGVHRINFNKDLNYGSVTDIEGNVYKTIEIGDQTWMAENLKTTRFNNNVPIPEVTDWTVWSTLETPGYCWYDNDSTTYRAVSGALYNGYVVKSGNICPTGWHVPTKDERDKMLTYIGGSIGGGIKLKEAGGVHWNDNVPATNEFGFTGVPAGWRFNNTYARGADLVFWWASTEFEYPSYGFLLDNFGIGGPSDNVGLSLTYPLVTPGCGLSIRCIKDSPGK